MKKIIAMLIVICMVCSLCSCSTPENRENEKLPVKLLIVPKFETGEMSGDDIGEAQLFYENYCMESETYELKNGYSLYYNRENKVALGITTAGKEGTVMFLTAVLGDERFDYSDTYIMCVGCCGGSVGYMTMGDVAVIQDTVDFDSCYESTSADENGDIKIKWFGISDTADRAHKSLNRDLVKWVYEKTKDIEMKTTEITKNTLKRNFPGEEWAERDPKVLIGSSVTSDTYWKGYLEHEKANDMVSFYECEYPYAATEMEDTACAVAVESFGLLDRLIILRVSVNADVFLDGATAELTWGDKEMYMDSVNEGNKENLDIFIPAMENLFAVGKVVGDAILDGTIGK